MMRLDNKNETFGAFWHMRQNGALIAPGALDKNGSEARSKNVAKHVAVDTTQNICESSHFCYFAR
jgi:hypothetical protein